MRYIIFENRLPDLVEKIVNILEPNFTEEKAGVASYTGNGDDDYLSYYKKTKPHVQFARYYFWKKELVLARELFESLESYFGDQMMTYVIDWFNNEFEQDAQSVTY